jgi:antitoxin component YwqK of YwqJK toxin-antitoxin module
MRKFALFASLVVSSQCFADTNADRPNLDDPEVLKKIIDQAVELEVVKKADGSLQYFEPLDFAPYQGSGWGVIYYDSNDQDEPRIIYISEDKVDSNRKPLALFQLLKGKREGLAITWHENGQKQIEVNFVDGKQDGLTTHWYENGQKKEEGHWKDGKKDGLGTIWYENGQKKSESHWKDNKANGFIISWYNNGQKKNQVLVSNNEVVDGNVWLPNGETCSASDLKNGIGVLVSYDNDGTEVSRTKFKDGVKIYPE